MGRKTDSLDSILLLLHQLKLLDRFVKQVQQHVRTHINEIAGNNVKRRNEIYQFLAIENIKNKKDVKRIAEFINKIKSKFTNLPDVVLEQQIDVDQCASTRKLVMLSVKQLDHGLSNTIFLDNLDDAITEINIVIEKYFKHLSPGQRAKLFGEPKHATEARILQAEIEKIRETSSSKEDLRTRLETALFSFIGENPKGGPRLGNALNHVYDEIHKQKPSSIIKKNI